MKMNYGSSPAIFALPTRETPEPNEPVSTPFQALFLSNQELGHTMQESLCMLTEPGLPLIPHSSALTMQGRKLPPSTSGSP